VGGQGDRIAADVEFRAARDGDSAHGTGDRVVGDRDVPMGVRGQGLARAVVASQQHAAAVVAEHVTLHRHVLAASPLHPLVLRRDLHGPAFHALDEVALDHAV